MMPCPGAPIRRHALGVRISTPACSGEGPVRNCCRCGRATRILLTHTLYHKPAAYRWLQAPAGGGEERSEPVEGWYQRAAESGEREAGSPASLGPPDSHYLQASRGFTYRHDGKVESQSQAWGHPRMLQARRKGRLGRMNPTARHGQAQQEEVARRRVESVRSVYAQGLR